MSLYNPSIEETRSYNSKRPLSYTFLTESKHLRQRKRMSIMSGSKDVIGERDTIIDLHRTYVRRRNNSLPDITAMTEMDSNPWCRQPSCKRYSLQRSQSVEWDPVSAMFTATTEDDTAELERILTEFELDLNFLSLAGVSPLHTAALVGSAEAVKLLLEFGAEVDFLDHNGSTTLEIALLTGNFDCASLLINAGASMGNVVDGIKIH